MHQPGNAKKTVITQKHIGNTKDQYRKIFCYDLHHKLVGDTKIKRIKPK